MIISHKINQHLDRKEEQVVDMVQGDTGRELVMNLLYQNANWTVPEGTTAMIRFAKSDGTGGCYDTLPNGESAWSISASTVTVRLVPQVLAVPGIVRVQVLLIHEGNEVATFSALVRVQADPTMEVIQSEDYVNLSRWIGEEVAKQVTDAIAPPAVLCVTVDEGAADCEFSDLEDGWQENRGLCCCYEGMILWLQQMVSGSFCTFSGIRGEELVTVTITQDSVVSIQTAPLAKRIHAQSTLRPSFAWIDDDGKEKVGHLFTWAKNNNVPFTTALISGWIAEGKSGWLSAAQVEILRSSELVSFASHTQNHVRLTNADRATVEAELKNSKEQIESWGVPCDVMVYPNGAINDSDIDLVHKYFPCGFLAGGTYDANNIPNSNRVNTCPLDTYKLKRVDIRGDFTEENGGIAYVKGQIDEAIASNGLLVFMSHIGSTDNGSGGYLDPSADLAVYTEILGYIREKGYDIEPLMTVCERFANPVDVRSFALGADGSVRAGQGNVHVVVPYNTYTTATLPSQYPKNQVTTCQIYDSAAPGASLGVLTAYVTDTLAYRTYMPQSSAILYLQIRSSTTDAWQEWSKCNQKDFTKLGNNKILSTTLPSALPSGVSICIVASSTDIANLPEGVMGMMTAYNLFSGADKAREEWQPNGSANKYVRYAISTGAWSPWYVFSPTQYA